MKSKLPVVLIGLLILACIGGRFYARHSAMEFGNMMAAVSSSLASSSAGDTAGLREFFEDPETKSLTGPPRGLSFLGGGYHRRIEELKTGLIYLSEQHSVAPEQRFSKPPVLKQLALDQSDRSDRGLINAAFSLIDAYRRGL